MPLIDLKTDLKSLRYGNDTLGGGDSGQPYIQKAIPDSFNNLGSREDFLLRGGINTVADSITDVSRLTKMFFDLKSVNGVFFTAKQNLLSRTAVRTQTSGDLNDGVYTPLSTLAQAGVNAFGGHLNKQGVNPFELTGAYSNNNNLYGVRVKTDQPADENRLFRLHQAIEEGQSSTLGGFTLNGILGGLGNKNDPKTNVLSYSGGPDAILGIGNTNIRFASSEQRTGKQNKYFVTNLGFFNGTNHPSSDKNIANWKWNNFSKSISGIYEDLTGAKINNGFNNEGQRSDTLFFSVYDPSTIPGNTWPDNTDLVFNNGNVTLNQKQIDEVANTSRESNDLYRFNPAKIIDFRKELKNKDGQKIVDLSLPSSVISKAPNYSNDKRLIDGGDGRGRINQTSPGRKGNVISYTAGKRIDGTISPIGATDRINALPIYRSQDAVEKAGNDLIKFRIAAIDNNSPAFKTFMHFRALLGGMGDAYTSNWNSIKYLGRGEDFYTYGGFSRAISLSWTVVAQSKEELIPMYKKLNYLASTMAPDYSGKGYMRGNLMQLTVGGYLFEQQGFFTSLNYNIPDDTTWEIGINDSATNYDKSVKEMPHRIEVTAAFTPIQSFIPSKMEIKTPMSEPATGRLLTDTNTYGDERFIALATGTKKSPTQNNYDK